MAYVIKQYLLPEDKTTEYLILVITLFLIIIIWAGILYKSTYFGEGQVKALLLCDPGECPTNKFTGEKRCNVNKQLPLQYDPIYEVCNPQNSCTAFETPYALLPDGSISLAGNCGDRNDGCSCVSTITTPSYIEAMFNQTDNIAANVSGNQNFTYYNQTPNPYLGQGNNVPMVYEDPTTQFWKIGIPDLPFITPNVCYDLYGDNPVVGIGKNLECLNRNPCINGRLAYVPNNSSAYVNFNANVASGKSNLLSTYLACVPNSVVNPPSSNLPNTCKSDIVGDFYWVPVFNTSDGRIHCFHTDIPIVS